MALQFKLVIFFVGSIGFAWLSRSSLRDFHSHGFYRFFAWEAILILVLLNLKYWFFEPFSINQIISWSLLIVSLYLIIHGFQLFRQAGKLDPERKDPHLIGIEKTTELVTVGAYRYIRHPFYSSLLFLAWGVFFKHPTWIGGSLTIIASVFLVLTAKVEEAENILYFGDVYQGYMKETKMFIPFIF